MKKILFLVACLSLTASGPARAAEGKAADAAAPAEAWKNKTFTAEELKKYNGKDGMPVYVAVDGIVYNLSGSKYWKSGQHMKLHQSGTDLSSAIHKDAPPMIHKDGKILGKMPKVGVLAKDAPQTAGAPAAGSAVSGVSPHKIAKEELGKDGRCAVTRKSLKVTEATPAVEYKGKTYYFSSSPLLEKFSKEPEKYTDLVKEKTKGLLKKKA